MYTPVKKRFIRPVNRRNVSKNRIKKIAIFLTVLALAEGAFLFWYQGKSYFENIKLPPALTWQIKTINIVAPTEKLKKQLETEIKKQKINLNVPFSSKEAKNLEDYLNENIKYVKHISVSRKFFTKELLVSAEKFTPFAQISTPQENFFTTEDGRIFKDDDPQNKGGFLNIYLNAKIESEILAKELVQFIKEIKTTSLRNTNNVTLNIKEQTAEFNTKFGPVKLKNFKEVKKQLSVLTEIFKISQGKNFHLPYYVDFTYFNKGKVYLKQEYKDL
jgi:hypothetical protein